MNLKPLEQPSVTIGRNAAAGGAAGKRKSHLGRWLGFGAALLVLAGLVFAFLKRSAGADAQTTATATPSKCPAKWTASRSSPCCAACDANLGEPQQQELQQDIQRVQQSCFGTHAAAMSETDLRTLAEKWLRTRPRMQQVHSAAPTFSFSQTSDSFANMSTITAILEPDADGTLHLPLPAELRRGMVKVEAKLEAAPAETSGTSAEERRQSVLGIMERIRARNPFQNVRDPAAWQREMRADVELPGRE